MLLCESSMKTFITILALVSFTGTAWAEGSDDVNDTQALRSGAQLYVDILDPETESIRWTGVGSVAITDPSGAAVATLESGETAALNGKAVGAYGVRTSSGQVVGIRWDVEVVDQTDSRGRLFSYNWPFNAGSFAPSRATYASFYALIPGGEPESTAVIELKLDGLAGYVYNINANATGVNGPNAGRSVPMYGHTVTPLYAIYLNPPSISNYSRATPEAYNLDYVGGVSEDVNGDEMPPCSELAPGASYGVFQFNTNVTGTYHLKCDLNRDGVYDLTSGVDYLAVGTATPGLNSVWWNGVHQGTPISSGEYTCVVSINVGEFHYVGSDIETSYQGMRLYEVAGDSSRAPLTMFWNDSLIQDNAQEMPNGEVGLASSGQAGMDPGPYTSDAVANVNARSWGNFNSTGKGNVNYLDTYTWLASSTSAPLTIKATDPTLDTDGDGLSDFEERCYYGTDPEDDDTDNDGVDDGTQYDSGSSSGGVGGLESNGRMAKQLARRAILRSRFTPSYNFAIAGSPLRELFQDQVVDGLTSVETSPSDLIDLTNADDVFAMDYINDDGRVLGSIFVAESTGEVYEHSKALCDRAGGSTLVSVAERSASGLLAATYRQPDDATFDHASTFKLYLNADGTLELKRHWLRHDYPAPAAGQQVLNVQVWARDAALLDTLSAGLLGRLEARELLPSADLTVLDEGTVDGWELPVDTAAEAPRAIVQSGELRGSTMSLNVARLAGSDDSQLSVRLTSLSETGVESTSELLPLDGPGRSNLDIGLVKDVTVDLYDGDTRIDQVWLSDGSWAQFDDGLFGGQTVVERFTASDCLPQTRKSTATGDYLELSGCAAMHASSVAQYAGVARHLPRGFNAANYQSVDLAITATAPVTVCFEDTQTGQRACEEMPASAIVDGWMKVSLADAQAAMSTVRLVTVTLAEAGELEVARLALSSEEAPTIESPTVLNDSGCQGGQSPGGLMLVLALAALMGTRRRHHVG